MAIITTIPLPPMCDLPDNRKVARGEQISWLLKNNTKFTGELIDYIPTKEIFIVRTKDKQDDYAIPADSIQLMEFKTRRPYLLRKFAEHDINSHLSITDNKQQFTLTYKDDGTLEEETRSFHIDHNGIFIFPCHADNRYTISFISLALVHNYNVGPRLGEVLIEEQLVTEEHVNSGLAVQKASRNQPIGEYLCNNAIVTTTDLEKALAHQKTMPHLKLGEILISENLISEKQLDVALEEQKQNRNNPLGEILIQQGLVDRQELQQSLAKKLGIPFVDLQHFKLDEKTLLTVEEKFAREHNILPLYQFGTTLAVALEDPNNWQLLKELRFQTGMNVEPVMASLSDIHNAIDAGYVKIGLDKDTRSQFGDIIDKTIMDETVVSDSVVVKLINKIITDAYNKGASDIHIETYPGNEDTLIRIRKDGILTKYIDAPPQLRSALISRIKIMAGLNVIEKRLPQDGKINFGHFSNLKIELRVATLPTSGDLEDVVLRILSVGKPIPLTKIDLSDYDFDNLRKLINTPNGLFLVCGPTGSGKTTTLHSILSELNTSDVKIWTVEDPVEITQQGLRQLQIKPNLGLTFTTALRAFLRADPDIIMVGEMRDAETVHTTIEASLTGHKVFSTMHTNSAPESINRLLDLGMDPFNFADALDGILSQRLARRICMACGTNHLASADEIDKLLLEYCNEYGDEMTESLMEDTLSQWRKNYANENGEFTLRKACGCKECNNTGYAGRIGLYELLINSSAIKHHCIERAPVSKIKRTALAEGMHTLKQDGIKKVLAGHTDIQQVHRECS